VNVRAPRREVLRRSHAEIERRGARIKEMARAQQRLSHLYEISKLLMGLRDVGRTMPEVIAIVAQTLPIRSAIVIRATTGTPLTIIWQQDQTDREPTAALQAALAHARAKYEYLLRLDARRTTSEAKAFRAPRGSNEGFDRIHHDGRNFIVLPLVVEHGVIFGTFQLEGAVPFDEGGLEFVNAVVNQLAIAVDLQNVTLAIQADADTAQREQRLLVEAGTIVTSFFDRRGALAAVAHRVVPLFADLCIVDEAGHDGALRRVEVVFSDARKQRDLAEGLKGHFHRAARNTPQAKVFESGKPLLFPEVTNAPEASAAHCEEQAHLIQAAGVRSMMILPLRARGEVFGVVTFAMAESSQRYCMRDLVVAAEFARRVAKGMDNAALYERAQQAMHVRQNLLSVVSHDLKNPLGSILMTVDVLLELDAGQDRRKSSRNQLELVRRAGLRMNRLIEDLLDTASIEGGQLSIDKQALAVAPQVQEALEAVQPLAVRKELQIKSELSSGLHAVYADATRLQQVFSNLLGNAIKFSPKRATITVRARAVDNQTIFEVADTGPGIMAADLPHLFDRFWQAERTAKFGTGLGLFIVRGIVEAHGGRVWVASKPGEGTTFSFTMPAATLQAERAGPSPVH
jgi:signal transduction histidine kinase